MITITKGIPIICIYKITSPSNKVYIGQTVNLYQRVANYKGLHTKGQSGIFSSLNKYGVDNHKLEILLQFEEDSYTQEHLDYAECFYMAHYRLMGYKLMNLREGGGSHGKMGEVSRKKMSESAKKRYERDGPPKHEVTEETRRKISEAQRGRKQSPETILKRAQALRGRKQNREAVEKTRLANIGKIVKQETRDKIGNANRGMNNGNARPVVQLNKTGVYVREWNFIKEASTTLGLIGAHITEICRGSKRRLTTGGFKWMYKEDYEKLNREQI